MIQLVTTTDKLQLVTSAAVAVDVVAFYTDLSAGSATPGNQKTAISTATTTDILAAPGASTYRRLQMLNVRNKGASDQTVSRSRARAIGSMERQAVSTAQPEAPHVEEMQLDFREPAPAEKFAPVSPSTSARAPKTLVAPPILAKSETIEPPPPVVSAISPAALVPPPSAPEPMLPAEAVVVGSSQNRSNAQAIGSWLVAAEIGISRQTRASAQGAVIAAAVGVSKNTSSAKARGAWSVVIDLPPPPDQKNVEEDDLALILALAEAA